MPKKLIAVVVGLLSLVLGPAAMAQEGGPVTVEVKAAKAAVVPGDQFAVAVIFVQDHGWHIHPARPVPPAGVDPKSLFPTKVGIAKSEIVESWPPQWPPTVEAMVAVGPNGEAVPYRVHEGRTVVYIPVQVSPKAIAGTRLKLTIAISYQACNDRSCLLLDEFTRDMELPVVSIEEAAAMPRASADDDFARFDPTGFQGGAASKRISFNAFGLAFELDASGAGFVLLLMVAALGGFLLNLTPCVLPVVPLKVMGLAAAAGNPARCLLLGTVMSLGVVAFWLAIGAAIAFISGFTAINSLFQTPWFSLGVGVFIALMAVGMLGAYVIQLPQAVYLFNPRHESVPGSFLFGIMTAVLSTPCTAPFMGSAAAWAATQPSTITLATFSAIGAGMALPYLILSAFPGLVSRIPRTGPASELVKQIMGLLLVAVAIFFLGTGLDPLLREPIDPPFRFFWWIIAGVAVGAMLWLMYRAYQITRSPVRRAAWTVFAMLFAAVSVMVARAFTDRGPIPWVGFTPERLAEAQSQGKVAVLDFTAEWCLNCKALEATVLHRSEIVALMKHEGVAPLKVDLTGPNIPGKQKLKEMGWVGIPLLVFYGPGLAEPIKYDMYTPEMVRQAIIRAAGPGSAVEQAALAPAGAQPDVDPPPTPLPAGTPPPASTR
ncbi:MAG: thioredoxin family protein [Phycisphaerales bacterium]